MTTPAKLSSPKRSQIPKRKISKRARKTNSTSDVKIIVAQTLKKRPIIPTIPDLLLSQIFKLPPAVLPEQPNLP